VTLLSAYTLKERKRKKKEIQEQQPKKSHVATRKNKTIQIYYT
jgi:hypothetical protein